MPKNAASGKLRHHNPPVEPPMRNLSEVLNTRSTELFLLRLLTYAKDQQRSLLDVANECADLNQVQNRPEITTLLGLITQRPELVSHAFEHYHLRKRIMQIVQYFPKLAQQFIPITPDEIRLNILNERVVHFVQASDFEEFVLAFCGLKAASNKTNGIPHILGLKDHEIAYKLESYFSTNAMSVSLRGHMIEADFTNIPLKQLINLISLLQAAGTADEFLPTKVVQKIYAQHCPANTTLTPLKLQLLDLLILQMDSFADDFRFNAKYHEATEESFTETTFLHLGEHLNQLLNKMHAILQHDIRLTHHHLTALASALLYALLTYIGFCLLLRFTYNDTLVSFSMTEQTKHANLYILDNNKTYEFAYHITNTTRIYYRPLHHQGMFVQQQPSILNRYTSFLLIDGTPIPLEFFIHYLYKIDEQQQFRHLWNICATYYPIANDLVTENFEFIPDINCKLAIREFNQRHSKPESYYQYAAVVFAVVVATLVGQQKWFQHFSNLVRHGQLYSDDQTHTLKDFSLQTRQTLYQTYLQAIDYYSCMLTLATGISQESTIARKVERLSSLMSFANPNALIVHEIEIAATAFKDDVQQNPNLIQAINHMQDNRIAAINRAWRPSVMRARDKALFFQQVHSPASNDTIAQLESAVFEVK